MFLRINIIYLIGKENLSIDTTNILTVIFFDKKYVNVWKSERESDNNTANVLISFIGIIPRIPRNFTLNDYYRLFTQHPNLKSLFSIAFVYNILSFVLRSS